MPLPWHGRRAGIAITCLVAVAGALVHMVDINLLLLLLLLVLTTCFVLTAWLSPGFFQTHSTLLHLHHLNVSP
jgi:hypothetical protein